MKRAIREHLRDFIAIVALIIAGLVTAGVILSSQAAALPSWLPFLGDRFALKAEFTSAQAITPGQGQAVVVAGIQIGDITGGAHRRPRRGRDGDRGRVRPLIKDDACSRARRRASTTW